MDRFWQYRRGWPHPRRDNSGYLPPGQGALSGGQVSYALDIASLVFLTQDFETRPTIWKEK